ncbi:CDP-alcohol phosphatidyltransferase family protein [Pacificoceanicola onchidii]|uniref:CDP-alcohol phosphatidyltransferase family protein n=1 Tax=Pacificoceanicola onchidii TaxID=2562685 RepID=UPI0010A68424|nr:CDP-alcohol phosphatidyltransferase family protein [Pacificoceanicola onchidii]
MTESRRPLKSRDTALAARAAQKLAATHVTPNQISAASIGFALLAGGAFCLSDWSVWWLLLAALGVQMRLLCNLLDGMVAIEGGKKSATGAFWNEAPDRLADILILVGMGFGAGIPALGWAAAALAVLTAYVRELGVSAGAQADFSGPMAKPHRMAVATGAALLALVLPVAWPVLEIGLWVITLGAGATALRRSARVLEWLKRNG